LDDVIQEEKLEPIIIDLNAARDGNMDEMALAQFGAQLKWMLGRMFAGAPINAMFRGNKRDIDSFGKVLFREKNYMNSYLKYGLNDPKSFRSKADLTRAITNFERDTGIKWPFK